MTRSNESKRYVWSSNSTKTLERYLKELGISNLFDGVVSRDDVYFIKPDPEGFSLIDDGTSVGKYLFYGDSQFDKDAARALDVDYVDVATLP